MNESFSFVENIIDFFEVWCWVSECLSSYLFIFNLGCDMLRKSIFIRSFVRSPGNLSRKECKFVPVIIITIISYATFVRSFVRLFVRPFVRSCDSYRIARNFIKPLKLVR